MQESFKHTVSAVESAEKSISQTRPLLVETGATVNQLDADLKQMETCLQRLEKQGIEYPKLRQACNELREKITAFNR